MINLSLKMKKTLMTIFMATYVDILYSETTNKAVDSLGSSMIYSSIKLVIMLVIIVLIILSLSFIYKKYFLNHLNTENNIHLTETYAISTKEKVIRINYLDIDYLIFLSSSGPMLLDKIPAMEKTKSNTSSSVFENNLINFLKKNNE